MSYINEKCIITLSFLYLSLPSSFFHSLSSFSPLSSPSLSLIFLDVLSPCFLFFLSPVSPSNIPLISVLSLSSPITLHFSLHLYLSLPIDSLLSFLSLSPFSPVVIQAMDINTDPKCNRNTDQTCLSASAKAYISPWPTCQHRPPKSVGPQQQQVPQITMVSGG